MARPAERVHCLPGAAHHRLCTGISAAEALTRTIKLWDSCIVAVAFEISLPHKDQYEPNDTTYVGALELASGKKRGHRSMDLLMDLAAGQGTEHLQHDGTSDLGSISSSFGEKIWRTVAAPRNADFLVTCAIALDLERRRS